MVDFGVQEMVSAEDELVRSAWEQYGKGNLEQAEHEFRLAIERKVRSVEAHYGLGVVLKVAKRYQESIAVFERLISLLERTPHDRIRAEMLRRLVHGYLNLMRSGDWGLESEIWKRSS